MGVKITISGVKANGGQILTGSVINGGHTNIQIKDLEMQRDAELLNGMCVAGEKAGVDIKIDGAKIGEGAGMLNEMNVAGTVQVEASGLILSEGVRVMDGRVVGDGECLNVDLSDTQGACSENSKPESHDETTVRGGLLNLLFRKYNPKREKDGNKEKKVQPTIRDRVSGNGKFRDPAYSDACTGDGSFQKPEKDKGQTR